MSQTILFTTDEDILEEVAAHDQQFEVDVLAELEEEEDMKRPLTADVSAGTSQVVHQFQIKVNSYCRRV